MCSYEFFYNGIDFAEVSKHSEEKGRRKNMSMKQDVKIRIGTDRIDIGDVSGYPIEVWFPNGEFREGVLTLSNIKHTFDEIIRQLMKSSKEMREKND